MKGRRLKELQFQVKLLDVKLIFGLRYFLLRGDGETPVQEQETGAGWSPPTIPRPPGRTDGTSEITETKTLKKKKKSAEERRMMERAGYC